MILSISYNRKSTDRADLELILSLLISSKTERSPSFHSVIFSMQRYLLAWAHVGCSSFRAPGQMGPCPLKKKELSILWIIFIKRDNISWQYCCGYLWSYWPESGNSHAKKPLYIVSLYVCKWSLELRGGALMLCNDSWDQKENESSSFLARTQSVNNPWSVY